VRELAADAYASLDQVTRRVDTLLDLSRLQAGELPLRSGPTDVADKVYGRLTPPMTPDPSIVTS